MGLCMKGKFVKIVGAAEDGLGKLDAEKKAKKEKTDMKGGER